MKKATINISYDEEKLSALKMYLEQKGANAESELVKALDTLYAKNVPAGVRDFIDMKSGSMDNHMGKPARSRKPSPSSAVGALVREASDNEPY